MRSGPLPDPATLVEYEAAVPGSAQIIVNKFDMQSDHRRDMEALVITGNNRRADRGQWMAFSLAALSIVCGSVLAWYGKETAGLGAIITAASSLVLVFVAGKLRQGKDPG
jgi:Predicted membrane protein